MNRSGSVIVAAVTAALNWVIFYYFGVYVAGSEEPAFKATIILASLMVHELFHVIAFEREGIRAGMIFLVILGGAFPFPGQDKKYSRLRWASRAKITLYGPLGNIVVIFAALGLQIVNLIDMDQLADIINLNGVLILYNLIPIMSKLDGGQYVKLLFDSSPEAEDHKYTVIISLLFMSFVLLISRFSMVKFFLSAILLFWSLNFWEKRDDPKASKNHLAMSSKERFDYSVWYLAMMVFSMTLIAFTEPWVH